MKKNGEKRGVSLTAKILAAVLAGFLIFSSVASVLFYLFA